MANTRVLLFVLVAALAILWFTGGTAACAWSPTTPAGAGAAGGNRKVLPPTPALEVGDPTRRPRVLAEPTGRDLFRERPSPPPQAIPPRIVAPMSLPPAVATESPVPAYPAAPPLVLSGVAEDGGVRTAIIAGGGDVWLAKTGSLVAGRFRVEAIDDDAVTLVDGRGGPTLRLRLR